MAGLETPNIEKGHKWKQWFIPFLLLFMTITLVFSQLLQEPYPAVYQPSFSNTSPNSSVIRSQTVTITATPLSGEQTEIFFNDLFPFAPNRRGVQFFYFMKSSNPEIYDKFSSRENSIKSKIKRVLYKNYEEKELAKKQSKFNELHEYLITKTTNLMEEEISELQFRLYKAEGNLEINQNKFELIDSIRVTVN